ncbi:MAG: hypothetical protein WC337_08240 [Candidatus Muiribacteriota bacterium]
MTKKMIYLTIVMFTVITCTAMTDGFFINNVSLKESLNNGEIQIDITYDGFLNGQLYLHYGLNGWSDINRIALDRNSISLIIPRNTAQIDFCFTNGKEWDNNNDNDWSKKLKNFLTDSFMSNLGNYINKYDFLIDTQEKIEKTIILIENHYEQNDDNNRRLKVLKELYEKGNYLTGRIMFLSKNHDSNDKRIVDCEFDYYVKMAEEIL